MENSVYAYVTPQVVADFAGAGTQALLEVVHADMPAAAASDTLGAVFTELLMALQDRAVAVDDAVRFVRSAVTDEPAAVVFCQVFDVFPPAAPLRAAMAQLCEGNVIQAATLAEHADTATLVALGLVPGDALARQMNTRKRDQYFTQKKFNLLHEEYEGFSALVGELHALLSTRENAVLAPRAVAAVHRLVGHYSLDPNRVLDVVLDVFACHVVANHRFIAAFFRASRWWPHAPADCRAGLAALAAGGSPAVASVLALRLAKLPSDRDLSESHKVLVALLIKEGVVSFGAVYPHLAPGAAAMDLLEQTYQKELAESVFRASASALALAAPLADEGDAPAPAPAQAPPPPVSVASLLPHNHKLQMLKCFLGCGLYWPALYILARHPFLVHVDAEVATLMHRMLAAMLAPLHSAISPFSAAELADFQQKRQVASSRPMNKVHLEDPAAVSLYCVKPPSRPLGNKTLAFFYTEWSSGLPVLSCAKDLPTVFHELIKYFGPALAADASNFIKLCEIISHDLASDPRPESRDLWFNYLRNYILPAVGFLAENALAVNKAYDILKHFSPDERFNLYGELHQVTAKNNPHVKIAYGKAERATKDVLKRLSKENVKPMMRRLAKISFSNPLPCFLTILQQLESYDNLNSLVVETAAYFNDYGWDNLTLAIMMRLTTAGRSNVQSNGLNDRQWVQSLSSFVGKICQKYPHCVDLSTIFRYLLRSFHSSGTTDLLVLKEILSCTGGIQSIANLTQLQINMMNCEPSLEKVVLKTIGDLRYDRKQSGEAVCKTLVSDGVVNEMFVLLCNLNAALVSDPSMSHLKVMATRKDELDAVMHLYCTVTGVFAHSSSSFLPLSELIAAYNVPVPWAFELWRKHMAQESIEHVSPQLAAHRTPDLAPDLFVAFWKLGLYDINYSAALYDSELAKLQSKLASTKEEYSFLRRDKSSTPEKLQSMRGTIAENEALIARVPQDKERHAVHSSVMTGNLAALASAWFSGDTDATNKALFEQCILPRAVHSSFDATYSATFLFHLHRIGVPGFSLFAVLDKLFRGKVLFCTLFTSTPIEAENLGLFISAIFKELNSWTVEKTFTAEMAKNTAAASFAEFKKSLYDYHSLVLADVGRALTVTTYMSRMNAITFLKNLLGIYPIVEDHCERIIQLIGNIAQFEARDDLKLSSSALIGHVKSRKKHWVHVWDFIELSEDDKAAAMAKRSAIEDEERKRDKAQEARKRQAREKEERERAAAERKRREAEISEQQKQASAKAISYEESSAPATRSARTESAAKGRYDHYAKASRPETKPDSRDATADPRAEKPEAKAAKPDAKPVASAKSDGADRTARPNGREQHSDDLFKSKVENPGQRSQTLKQKLEQAKSEYRARSRPDSKSASPARDATPTAPAATPAPFRPASGGARRAPLPPQKAPLPSYKAPPQKAPLPPQKAPLSPQKAPPPQKAAPASQKAPLPAQKAPSASQKGPLPPPKAPLPPQKAPLPPQKAPLPPPRVNGGRDNAGRDRAPAPRSAPRNNYRNERFEKGDRFANDRNERLAGSGSRARRPSGGAPLPPPPVPPPKRDARNDDSRYRKRSYEGSGRENDKRSRY